MNQSYVGFFEYRKERYEFEEGIAEWDGHTLSAYASSSDVTVYFPGIPFGQVSTLDELNGKVYRGHGGETVFSEGVIRFFDKGYGVSGDAEIECVAANAEKGVVALEFRFEMGLANARTRSVRGGMRCVLGKIPHALEIGVDDE